MLRVQFFLLLRRLETIKQCRIEWVLLIHELMLLFLFSLLLLMDDVKIPIVKLNLPNK
jgi:hypothetical protein